MRSSISVSSRLSYTLLLTCLVLSGVAFNSSFVQAKTKFKIATIAPDNTPWSILLNTFKKRVRKATKKELKPRVYLNGIKGDEQSIVRQVYGGKLQMGGVSTAALATVVPEMDILELPYAFPDFKTADKVLDDVRPLVEEILNLKGLTLLMYSENGYRSFATQGQCIKSPADLKAKKMRSQESAVHVETYRALGASPVTISVGEVLSSLDSGVVVGFDNTPIIAQALGWSEKITHFSNTRHIYQPALIIMNKAWFDGLSEEQQKIIREKGKELEQIGRKMVRQLEPALMENFKKADVKVCDLTAAEIATFKEATAKVWDVRKAQAEKYAQKSKSKLGLQLIEAMRGNGK